MEESIKIVKQYYDQDSMAEWKRLEEHPFEFLLTVRMMEKYLKPGDRILDIGGGPGRYSLYFAAKGYDVTLVDLSDGNILLANQFAKEQKVRLHTYVGDARDVDTMIDGEFDHVFLMGPMYHLLEEKERKKAMQAALQKVKKGGNIYVSFILLFAGLIFEMKNCPELLLEELEGPFLPAVLGEESYAGDAFTKAFFIQQKEVEPFMSQFPIKKLHLFGQEGILAPCEKNILSQPKEIIDEWVTLAYQLCEREELLSYSEHIMYIGQRL